MVVPTDALRRAALNSTPRAAEEEEGGRGRKKSDDDDDEDRTRCCSAALEQEEEENLLLVRRIEEQLADDDDDDDEDENDVEARAKTLMMLSFYDASRCGESLTEIGKEKRIFLLETSPFAHRASLSSVRSKRRAREARRREKIPRERKRLHFF
jgi:hypothetical protein